MSLDPPLVSIVTPSFNQARFLRRTIDSVLAQTYPHIDYRVMDGGSTDGSVDILRSYGAHVRWVSRPDRGQAHAINEGFALSTGQIRAFLNSDDVLLPEAVAAVVEQFQLHPEVDLIYGQGLHIDENDGVLGAYPTASYSFERLLQDCCICQPAAFWRSAAALRVGPLDESLHFALDYDYWMRMDRAGAKLLHLPRLLAHSRLYAENKTLSRRLEVFREILAVSQRHAGHARFPHVLAYWTHLCHERQGGWPRWLRFVPGIETHLARAHYRWQEKGGKMLPFLGHLSRSLFRRMAV
jgi:glycosyltransferase involved in cell wall biosynthesis